MAMSSGIERRKSNIATKDAQIALFELLIRRSQDKAVAAQNTTGCRNLPGRSCHNKKIKTSGLELNYYVGGFTGTPVVC